MTVDRKVEASPVPFEEALTGTGNGTYNYLLACTCALILLAIGVDLFGFSWVVAAACDLHLTVAQKGILTSLPFVGILMVSYIWGYVSDTKGRRFTLMLSLQTGFVLSCISSLAPNWQFLAVIKFFSVCFSCAANSVTYTMIGESCIQKVRNKYMLMMTCLLLFSPAMGGILAYPTLKLEFAAEMPLIGLIFRPWRLLLIVLAIPSGIGGFAIIFFHESPKFLANSGRKEEALDVLKSIYAINHKRNKDDYRVTEISLEESGAKRNMSLFRAMYEQSAPLFRPPLLWRTLQLFYIVAVVYITNNSFLVWLPHILNMVRLALEADSTGNICSLISVKEVDTVPLDTRNYTLLNGTNTTMIHVHPDVCTGHVADNVIFTLVISQSIFAFLNFLLSYLSAYRKAVLLCVLSLSSASGALMNLMPEPISSVFFFVVFTCTCLGMGILASYFVDLYSTSYRGMASCLSIMVGRSSAFIGINLVGNLIFHHCQITFYFWAVLVLSSAIAALFLPPDKPRARASKL